MPEYMIRARGLIDIMQTMSMMIPWAANLQGMVTSEASLVPIAHIIKE
jgi:hypothetical protein